jgi:NitT/TauT family transport system substrate-binding protein
MLPTLVAAAVVLAAQSQTGWAQPLAVGALKAPSSGPLIVASAQSALPEGMKLRLFDSGDQVAAAATSGEIDVGASELTADFFKAAGRGALTIIAGTAREERAFHLVAYVVANDAYEKGLRTLDDLKGRTIGLAQLGSPAHYALSLLAVKRRTDLSSARLVPLQTAAASAAAVRESAVDVAVLPRAAALPMVQRDQAKLLGWVSDETPWQTAVIFTTRKTVAENRPALENFVRSYRKAAREFSEAFLQKGEDGRPKDGARAADMLQLLSSALGEPPERLRRAIPYVDPEGRLFVKDVQNQLAFYQRLGLVDTGADPRSIVDLSFVKEHVAR